jgi:cysteine desulfurase family protein (TIGR01976 family)
MTAETTFADMAPETTFDVQAARARFSSLDEGFTFLDAPGGSQVPDEVGEAVARTLREASANIGAPYATSKRVEQILAKAREDGARFLNATAEEVIFGPNMTSLNFALTRTASRDWKSGDRVLVSRLDHDGGVAPWRELADDRGFELDWIDVDDDLSLDLDDLERKLDERVRVVAFALASNAVGTVTDAARVTKLAHAAGALSWIDAVHYAAHEPIDVNAIDCDMLLCSPYKFCGPHLGLAYGRSTLLESWRPYKAGPAGSGAVGRRFETGTSPYELLAGFSATIAYLDSLGGLGELMNYERRLGNRFLEHLPDNVEIYGAKTMAGRVPTFLINVSGLDAATVASSMASKGYGVWADDNWYSLGLRPRLPYPDQALRVGLIHYNTSDEIDGFLSALAEMA